MSTKFVSKAAQLMIVLKSGIPGSTVTGSQPQPGLYVRFKDGFTDVKEESIAELMRKHTSFGRDFIEVDDKELDPFKDTREEVEPIHKIAEMKYGHIEKTTKSRPQKLPPEIQKAIEGEALKLAKKMLPGLVQETLKSIVAANKEKNAKGRKPETVVLAGEIADAEIPAPSEETPDTETDQK